MRASRKCRSLISLSSVTTGIVASVILAGAGASSLGALRAAPSKDQPDVKPAAPIPFPDGVIDPAGRTAFVSTPKGGIQAIQLDDGKVLWTNDETAAEPWLVAGDRLIARGDRLLVLDLKNDGKLLRKCDAPAYPKVDVPDKCTVAFNLWNPHVTGDALTANWYAVAQIDRSKGRPFAFQAWTAFNKVAPAGSIKANLATGRVEIQPDPKPEDVTAGLVPQAMNPGQAPADLVEKLKPVWQQYHKDQNGRIAVVGDRLVGVELNLDKLGAEYQKRVVLHTWDLKTGKPAEPVELIKGKALDIANIVLTRDRRHAAVQFSTSALTIYSLPDGKLVARDVKGVPSPDSAFVAGKRLYTVADAGRGGERLLKALDLDAGKVAWERAIKPRSTIPLPP
jgi:hypothetical protein